ncbi:MmcQ/YjbR family DNA-binding protein [Paenibacillus yanchengensis]|uniref:MmcQ/YjbR family DNA-binding protein n=1 Tax=Paenibacillus yanchengensis TaxID=2035833 RepID=A0ABW4YFF3_9BACL
MNIDERKQVMILHGNTKQGAEVYFREDWQCHYFSLLGKCFGMMNNEVITLKGNPDENEMLRITYQDVVPGYYANKTHWNSIYLHTTELSSDEIKHFIDLSYALVYQKLTKKEKATITESE